MQGKARQQWSTDSAEDTRALGASLGQQACRGDFIACCGALGAGKTTFVQGFAEGLGVGEAYYVRSPTFALMQAYHGRLPLYHFDFYRLFHAFEAQDIGFEDYIDADGVVIVEWADKFPTLWPAAHLRVAITILSPTRRHFECTTSDGSYARYLCLQTRHGTL
jgi:tRNA threonylcarbamoyladenosine biosynthesis protein TsaE